MGQETFVAAIDQGTTSSRCIVFNKRGRIVSSAQREHRQIFPRPGWVEHDATEIWANVQDVVQRALDGGGIAVDQLAAIGITNQRETVVLWDRETGEPVSNAIVWQDTRTRDLVRELGAPVGPERFRERTGLPLATYFSGPKFLWMLENIDGLRERAERGDILFGTMDSWLIWNLTGGTDGGRHVTDVTNASRTLLMNLRELDWDGTVLERMRIPRAALPEIVSSSEVYGTATGVLAGVPIAGALGDQHAALFGQTAFSEGDVKSTYGTGSFLLLNTGAEPVQSRHGLLTTVGYQIGDAPAVYALEGSIAVSGALVQWFRDQLGAIENASDIEALAASVADNGDCYVVPAFSGLFAPHWRSDARGVIVGLTGYVTKAHIARAILEASAWQTKEVVDAMAADTRMPLAELRVDGGMTANNLLLQILADALDVRVILPEVTETTCLGAAFAAGLAVGYWSGLDELRETWSQKAAFEPAIDEKRRAHEYRQWKKAVARTLDWVEPEVGVDR
ncbi:glycerol kinase [Cryobacterium mesophilum]|uniref:Glycerol kinase n=1 Tax=Terrimesophilobacter mesophilus TaxID=433647 RepID=A0A4R8VCT7_9MICO|nr:glycerol kinase GlpK [Terrimesophilobacter mesophilus]MBB5633170.1 glycerol kinase [Terrimesophilobacter mesophilus]TFB79922.1 glycerol kinase [Terrimesophilobacter mesophilus]